MDEEILEVEVVPVETTASTMVLMGVAVTFRTVLSSREAGIEKELERLEKVRVRVRVSEGIVIVNEMKAA